MTIKTLINIVLKVLGICFLREVLLALSQFISVVLFARKHADSEHIIITVCTLFLIFLIQALVCYWLIFKTDAVIGKLRLARDFDTGEQIQVNMDHSTVLKIAIIVVGGVILTQEIPNFCRQLYVYYEEKSAGYRQANPDVSYLVLAGSKILIGATLIGSAGTLVNRIQHGRKNETLPDKHTL